MIKAVFIDYTGTIIEDGGPDVQEMLMRCYANSAAESPKMMLAFWWKHLKELEEKSFGENFITEDEIVDELLRICVEKLHLKDNLEELHEICRKFWVYAPLYPDAKEFFEKCPLPIYVITNNGVTYVEKAMQINGLKPAGIISGEMARAYKPHKELFEKALEVCGLSRDEVIHIGDSVSSDVKGAQAAGIRPVLLDRDNRQKPAGITVVHSLSEAIDPRVIKL